MYKYQRLKDLREDKDMTQENIAQIIDTSREQYSRWGERSARNTIPPCHHPGRLLQGQPGLHSGEDKQEKLQQVT